MSERVEHYTEILEELDVETLTVLVFAGATVEEVAAILVAEAGLPGGELREDDFENSAYVVVEVPGGVLALEHVGYADPSVEALVALSSGGRSAAVVRDNIQAHLRFGWARDGVLLFDDDEFTFIDAGDRSRVPDELRRLFDLAWVDLDLDDEDRDEEGPDSYAVGLAMVEAATGVVLTAEDFERVAAHDGVHYPVRILRYSETRWPDQV